MALRGMAFDVIIPVGLIATNSGTDKRATLLAGMINEWCTARGKLPLPHLPQAGVILGWPNEVDLKAGSPSYVASLSTQSPQNPAGQVPSPLQ